MLIRFLRIFSCCVSFVFIKVALADGPSCADFFSGKPSIDAAFANLLKYEASLKSRLHEREYLVEVIIQALLMKEHVLLVGPPGNAKTMLARESLINIIDSSTGKPSYFQIQFTPETTISETHGPLDIPTLQKSGKYQRIYTEGMLKSKFLNLDEFFDARMNAIRNTLTMLVDRVHPQGTKIEPGEIWTAIASSNRYFAEVYDKAGDNSPRAVIDRFAYVAFVPGEFEYADSYEKLDSKSSGGKVKLETADLEVLNALLDQVAIPEYVHRFFTLLAYHQKEQTEALENSSYAAFVRARMAGENPKPPFRATKYNTPRTIGKAYKALRAEAVRRWMMSGKKGPLQANLDDLAKLETFFTLNGQGPEFISYLHEKTTNPHESNQLETIVQERKLFADNYSQILNDFNTVLVETAIRDFQIDLDRAKTPEERHKMLERLATIYIEFESVKPARVKMKELTGELIGQSYVSDFAKQVLIQHIGEEQFNKLIASEIEQAKVERVKQQTAQAEAAKKEAEAKQAQIAEEKRQARELEARKQRTQALAQAVVTQVNDSKQGHFYQTTSKLIGSRTAASPSGQYVAWIEGSQIKIWHGANKPVLSFDRFSANAPELADYLKKVVIPELMSINDNGFLLVAEGSDVRAFDIQTGTQVQHLSATDKSDLPNRIHLQKDKFWAYDPNEAKWTSLSLDPSALDVNYFDFPNKESSELKSIFKTDHVIESWVSDDGKTAAVLFDSMKLARFDLINKRVVISSVPDAIKPQTTGNLLKTARSDQNSTLRFFYDETRKDLIAINLETGIFNLLGVDLKNFDYRDALISGGSQFIGQKAAVLPIGSETEEALTVTEPEVLLVTEQSIVVTQEHDGVNVIRIIPRKNP